jgi:hypothetical protein
VVSFVAGHFDEPQPEWKATSTWNPPFGAALITSDADH